MKVMRTKLACLEVELLLNSRAKAKSAPAVQNARRKRGLDRELRREFMRKSLLARQNRRRSESPYGRRRVFRTRWQDADHLGFATNAAEFSMSDAFPLGA